MQYRQETALVLRIIRNATRPEFPTARALVFRIGGSARGIQVSDVPEIVAAMLADRRARV